MGDGSCKCLNVNSEMSIDDELDPIESEDDLFEHFSFVVDKGQQLLRIDKYLQLKISNFSSLWFYDL